jgi:(p)ppGpp synthase/HD superfamily hydrolase
MNVFDQQQWIINQHRNTNHMYDTYLPYEFHLRMVANVADRFMDIFPWNTEDDCHFRNAIRIAAFGHDLIEDTRVSYNDVKAVLGIVAADIIYAVSNEKGKTRAERANDKYYEGIRNTPGAVFVKMADRIANVQYSKMSGSRMFRMYQKENAHFVKSLGFVEGVEHELAPMYNYLETLFQD